eukprot:m.165713 g.165713  ORF g.165713 m.165713 type:complete len:231 (-) comp12596_c0_seq1:243-935(-)
MQTMTWSRVVFATIALGVCAAHAQSNNSSTTVPPVATTTAPPTSAPTGSTPQPVCTSAQYWNGAACVAVTNCTSSEYITANPTPTSNRMCAPISPACNFNPRNGSYELQAPNPGYTNRVCRQVTPCTGVEVTAVEPTPTSNYKCKARPNPALTSTQVAVVTISCIFIFFLGIVAFVGAKVTNKRKAAEDVDHLMPVHGAVKVEEDDDELLEAALHGSSAGTMNGTRNIYE